MAGELGLVASTANTAAVNANYHLRIWNGGNNKETDFNLAGLFIQYQELGAALKDAAVTLAQIKTAAEYLRDTGEWWKTVDIATLKQDIINAVGAAYTGTWNDLQDVKQNITGAIDSIGADLRWELFPSFSNLEWNIKNAVDYSRQLVTSSLSDIKTLINQYTAGKAGETALAIANAQSAILTAIQTKTDALAGAVENVTGAITAAVHASEKVVTDALAATQAHVEAFAAELAAKSTELVKGLFSDMEKFFEGAGDDIAFRVFEYFRSFVFDKEGE
jgi:hypothetical protein